jgi:hypothetical protein
MLNFRVGSPVEGKNAENSKKPQISQNDSSKENQIYKIRQIVK